MAVDRGGPGAWTPAEEWTWDASGSLVGAAFPDGSTDRWEAAAAGTPVRRVRVAPDGSERILTTWAVSCD